ncbi:uncharacterized protein LOC111258369 [Setaria italica]|uniref:uncharacterized protein LOC111258369 n=1 Tax=Setaria italica TaxID=4555 RepID=UPI000BE576C5|nr:uncharacterized protein LOC111258369 [Setaria italica]
MRRPKLSKRFVRSARTCMLQDDHSEPAQQQTFIWYDSYRPPHLLGLVRYHIVGRGDIEKIESKPYIKYSFSAMELAEIGITLSANKTMQLLDMRLNQEGTGLFPELSLAPLSLDRDRASYLVNMAALELCTVQSFMAKKQDEEDSAVCSYLLLLAKLVYREEDVHELRVRGLLLGGGGLTNEEALRFFTGLQGLRRGPYYFRVMDQIQIYRGECKGIKTKLHGFFHNHKKTIAAVASGVVSVGGIIGTLLSIKNTL